MHKPHIIEIIMWVFIYICSLAYELQVFKQIHKKLFSYLWEVGIGDFSYKQVEGLFCLFVCLFLRGVEFFYFSSFCLTSLVLFALFTY